MAAAQQPAELAGRVVRGSDSLPVADVAVSLHLITPDTGGVVATGTTDGAGRFRFEVAPPAGVDPTGVVYLVTARYREILYVGEALHLPSESLADYPIVVYEPRFADSLAVGARRSLVTIVGGALQIVDVFDLVNESDSALVRPPDAERGWELRLPDGAGRTAAGSTGFTEEAYEVRGDRLVLDLSVPPGGRSFSVRYRLPGPLVSLALDRPLPSQLVLVEEGAALEVGGLAAGETMTLDGRQFRRYLGSDRSPGEAVTLRLVAAADPIASRRLYAWLSLALGVVLAAAAVLVWRRSPLRSAEGAP